MKQNGKPSILFLRSRTCRPSSNIVHSFKLMDTDRISQRKKKSGGNALALPVTDISLANISNTIPTPVTKLPSPLANQPYSDSLPSTSQRYDPVLTSSPEGGVKRSSAAARLRDRYESDSDDLNTTEDENGKKKRRPSTIPGQKKPRPSYKSASTRCQELKNDEYVDSDSVSIDSVKCDACKQVIKLNRDPKHPYEVKNWLTHRARCPKITGVKVIRTARVVSLPVSTDLQVYR